MAATVQYKAAFVHVMAKWCSGSFAHRAPSLCPSTNNNPSTLEGIQKSRKGLRKRQWARYKRQIWHVQTPAGVTAEISKTIAQLVSHKMTSCS